MSIRLRFTHKVDSVLTDATSVVLSDPTGTYGVKRDDTDAVVVADGTAMSHASTGVYEYSFDPPAADLGYTYYVEWVYNGQTYQVPFTYNDVSRVLTLTEVKDHLRIDGDDQDTLLGRLIEAATSWAEKYQMRRYLTTACLDYLDTWPKVIRPRWVPLAGVTSIQYIDTGGTLQTWDSGEYDVDTDSQPGRVQPAYGCSYPSIRGDPNGIVVTYTAGYGASASAVPQEIRNAILLLVGLWYVHPENLTETQSSGELPYGISDMLGLERMHLL